MLQALKLPLNHVITVFCNKLRLHNKLPLFNLTHFKALAKLFQVIIRDGQAFLNMSLKQICFNHYNYKLALPVCNYKHITFKL